jgi:hypothetical protein
VRGRRDGDKVGDRKRSITEKRAGLTPCHKPDDFGDTTEVRTMKDCRHSLIGGAAVVSHAGETIEDEFRVSDCGLRRLTRRNEQAEAEQRGMDSDDVILVIGKPPLMWLSRECDERTLSPQGGRNESVLIGASRFPPVAACAAHDAPTNHSASAKSVDSTWATAGGGR